jgi:predicted phage-related endonuclease
MAYGIPLEIYQMLEKVLGKEDAQKAVEILQKSINESLESSEEKLKISISEDLKKELASKYDIELLRQEMKTLEIEFKKEIDIVRKEIEITRLEFKKDLRIAVIILIAIIVILNQNSLELLAKLFGIVK